MFVDLECEVTFIFAGVCRKDVVAGEGDDLLCGGDMDWSPRM